MPEQLARLMVDAELVPARRRSSRPFGSYDVADELYQDLEDNWLGIAIAVLVGLAAATAVFFFTPRQYTASTSLFVSAQTDGSADSAYQGGLSSEQRVKSYSDGQRSGS